VNGTGDFTPDPHQVRELNGFWFRRSIVDQTRWVRLYGEWWGMERDAAVCAELDRRYPL
jgi:hypothetical protein